MNKLYGKKETKFLNFADKGDTSTLEDHPQVRRAVASLVALGNTYSVIWLDTLPRKEQAHRD